MEEKMEGITFGRGHEEITFGIRTAIFFIIT